MKTLGVLKSGIWYTISNVLVKGLAFFTVPIFSRLMSKEEFGDYSNFISWLHIAAIVITLNVESTLISAKYDYKNKFDEYIFSVLILSMLSCVIWLFGGFVFRTELEAFTALKDTDLLWMLLYLIFITPISLYQVKQRYIYKYKQSVLISFSIAFFTTFLSILLVYVMTDKLEGRIIGSVLPVILIGFFFFLYFINKGKKIVFSYWRYALPVCLPFIPHLLSLMLLNGMDKIMINQICGPESNAMYSVAYTGGQIVTILISAMNLAFIPWLGDKMDEKNYAEIRSKSKYYILFFSYFAGGLMMASPEMLYLLGGEEYMQAIYVLTPVSMGCVCQFLYMLFVNIEQISKKTKGMAAGSIIAALINYVLNLMFIPIYGYVAAAYTTLVGYLCLLLIHMYILKRIGKSMVYDYKFIFYIVTIVLLYSFVLNFVFSSGMLRVLMLVVYLSPLVYYLKKFRNEIFKFTLSLKRNFK